MMKITTTLADIRKASPCSDGWETLLKALDVSPAAAKSNTDVLPVATVLDKNGVDDALWVIDVVIGDKYLSRCIAADMVEMVLHLFEDKHPGDNRPRKAIEVARDETSTEEAWDAARAAAGDAAGDAAGAAAGAAAWAAAGAAAGAAAWAAAEAAAWAAAGAAAEAAAWAALRKKQADRLRVYLEHGIAAKDMATLAQLEEADDAGA